jgi:hypothetical protein
LEAVKQADAAALTAVVSRTQAEAILRHIQNNTLSEEGATGPN